jgi:hypothetical protein
MLAQRHLTQPLRHRNAILPDINDVLCDRLAFLRRLMQRESNRDEQHDPDSQREE